MLLDLLRTDNYVSFNKKLAHTIGLEQAIYVNQIINIMGKAIKKNKVYNDGYVKVDRNYIFEQTTLTVERQLEIENSLITTFLLLKNFDNPDLVKIDTQLLADITSSDNVKVNEEISKKVTKNTKITKEQKQNIIYEKLKNYIDSGDTTLDQHIDAWLKTIVCDKGIPLNKEAVLKFQNDVYDYSKGNLQKALGVVDCATTSMYKECQWAINKYEKDNYVKLQSQPKETATKEKLANIEF